MSAIRPDQLDNTKKFMSEFWNSFVKPYYNPEKGDEYWDKTYEELCRLAEKYCKDDVRLLKMLLGFWDGLEREIRGNASQL